MLKTMSNKIIDVLTMCFVRLRSMTGMLITIIVLLKTIMKPNMRLLKIMCNVMMIVVRMMLMKAEISR